LFSDLLHQAPFAHEAKNVQDEYRRAAVLRVALSERARDRFRRGLIDPWLIDLPLSSPSLGLPPQSPRICERRAHERSLLTVEGAAFIGEQRCSLCGGLGRGPNV